MQPISSYATNDAYLRLLLQGPPGAGKTTCATQFPRPYVADLDLNLGGPLRFLKEKGRPLPIGYDTIDRDETGKEIDPKSRFLRLAKCLQDATANPDIETIIIDSATKLSDYITDEVMRQQNTDKMSIQLWGFYLAAWKKFINGMSTMKKHFVLIAHERVEKDEVDQSLKYFVMVPGQMGNIIGALFTDVWRAEVAEKSGIPPTYAFNIRTMPSYRFNLKNSLGLPPVFEFNWETIQKRLEGIK